MGPWPLEGAGAAVLLLSGCLCLHHMKVRGCCCWAQVAVSHCEGTSGEGLWLACSKGLCGEGQQLIAIVVV